MSAAIANPFLLVHVAAKIARKFHRPMKDRMPESIKSALGGLGEGRYLVKHFIRPDNRTFGVEVYDPSSTGHPKPYDALSALTTLTTGLPYFPPEISPAAWGEKFEAMGVEREEAKRA